MVSQHAEDTRDDDRLPEWLDNQLVRREVFDGKLKQVFLHTDFQKVFFFLLVHGYVKINLSPLDHCPVSLQPSCEQCNTAKHTQILFLPAAHLGTTLANEYFLSLSTLPTKATRGQLDSPFPSRVSRWLLIHMPQMPPSSIWCIIAVTVSIQSFFFVIVYCPQTSWQFNSRIFIYSSFKLWQNYTLWF